MKKNILIFLLFQTLTFSVPFCRVGEIKDNNYSEELSYKKIEDNKIYKSYILVDGITNEILIEDDIDFPYPIASLTKLMTAMVVLDNNSDIDKKIKISFRDANFPYGVRIKANNEYSIRDLLYFMLMMSSNSSAEALANSVSKDFIDLMNKKAEYLGLKNTSFCTAHGLPPKYTNTCIDLSSASDVYKMTKYALENYPIISEITSTKYKKIDGINLINSNELLRTNDKVKGVKTGFHDIAGYNISILFENNGVKLYEVILGSNSDENRKLISEMVLKNF